VPDPTGDAPSPAVTELIAVRDMVLLAGAGDAAPTPEVLRALARKLARVLEQDGVRVLEGDGLFDDRLQEALETRPTSDPAQDERISHTIRPGYAIGGRVIRPQQVAVYRLEA
jgi:molecular chaperone GrpE (heat shock protein)